jgi:hypothetical protein
MPLDINGYNDTFKAFADFAQRRKKFWLGVCSSWYDLNRPTTSGDVTFPTHRV